MKVEQFVMAYQVEQDCLRALLPDGFLSLRPVLRINGEIRDGKEVYLELNTPVQKGEIRGWLNIARWNSEKDALRCERAQKKTAFTLPFLDIIFTAVGITGGCPAEKDNQGCFFLEETEIFQPAEGISENREFCDCTFAWHFAEGDAHGESMGKTLPAPFEEPKTVYPKKELSAENAAVIACKQVLGAYAVKFERYL